MQKQNKIYKIYNIHLSPWYQFTCAPTGNWSPHAIFQKPQASKDNIYAVTRHGHKHLRPSSSSSTSSICSHHTLQSHHPKFTPSSTINLPSPWHIGTFRQGCGELPASFPPTFASGLAPPPLCPARPARPTRWRRRSLVCLENSAQTETSQSKQVDG